jgi:hypothetical protein
VVIVVAYMSEPVDAANERLVMLLGRESDLWGSKTRLCHLSWHFVFNFGRTPFINSNAFKDLRPMR